VAFEPAGDRTTGRRIAHADALERTGRSRAVGVELGRTRNRDSAAASRGTRELHCASADRTVRNGISHGGIGNLDQADGFKAKMADLRLYPQNL